MTSPIDTGLDLAAKGIAEARSRVERGRSAVASDLASLVNAEHRFRVMANSCARARQGRHLQAGELDGPRRRLRDGPPLQELHDLDAVVVRPTMPPPLPSAPARDWTAESLRIYGLHRQGDATRPVDERGMWRRILGREG